MYCFNVVYLYYQNETITLKLEIMKTLKLTSEVALLLISGEFYKDRDLQMEGMRQVALFNGYSLEWLVENIDEFMVMFINMTNKFIYEATKIANNCKIGK